MLKVWHERVEKDKDNDVQTDIAAQPLISGFINKTEQNIKSQDL